MDIYKKLIDLFDELNMEYDKPLVKESLIKIINDELKGLIIKVEFQYYNSFGEEYNNKFENFTDISLLLYINVKIMNIPSQVYNNKIIGNIEYGNSFIYLINDNNKYYLHNITKYIPNILILPINNNEINIINRFVDNMKSEVYSTENNFGKPLSVNIDKRKFDNVFFLTKDKGFTPLTGIYQMYDKSLIFIPNNSAPINIIPDEMCTKIDKIENDKYKCTIIEFYITNPTNMTSNHFYPMSDVYYIYIPSNIDVNTLFIDTFNQWKRNIDTPINIIVSNEIPNNIITHLYNINNILKDEYYNQIINQNRICDILLNNNNEKNDINDYIPHGKIDIIIIIGYFGSYIKQVGEYLTKNSIYELHYFREKDDKYCDKIMTKVGEMKTDKTIILCLETSKSLIEILNIFSKEILLNNFNIKSCYTVVNPSILYRDNMNRILHINQINNLVEDICDGIYVINRHNSIQKSKIFSFLSKINPKVEKAIVTISDNLDISIQNPISLQNGFEKRVKNIEYKSIILSYYIRRFENQNGLHHHIIFKK